MLGRTDLRRRPMAVWRIPNRNPRCTDKGCRHGKGQLTAFAIVARIGSRAPACARPDLFVPLRLLQDFRIRKSIIATELATVPAPPLTRGRRPYLGRLHSAVRVLATSSARRRLAASCRGCSPPPLLRLSQIHTIPCSRRRQGLHTWPRARCSQHVITFTTVGISSQTPIRCLL